MHLGGQAGVADRLVESCPCAAVVQSALKLCGPDDTEDQEHQAHERSHVDELWNGGEKGIDEDRHAGHALQRAKRTQGAHGAYDAKVAEGRNEDGQPREEDNDTVELTPGVSQIGVVSRKQAECQHLAQQLGRKYGEEEPFAHVDQCSLGCVRRVER